MYSEGVGCEILIGISSLTFLESIRIGSFLEAFWRERTTKFLHKESLLVFFWVLLMVQKSGENHHRLDVNKNPLSIMGF